jgi:hypothetical protein
MEKIRPHVCQLDSQKNNTICIICDRPLSDPIHVGWSNPDFVKGTAKPDVIKKG